MRNVLSGVWIVAASANLFSATLTGKVTVAGARDLRNTVVYFERIPGKSFPPPAAPVSVNQVNLAFSPHIVPVLRGTTVTFPNADDVVHNVFSPGPANKFNLGSYGRGAARSMTFTAPGEYPILCNVHAEMSAYVIVTETPYFAVTDGEGRFTISNIPAGKYTISTWREGGRSLSQTVEFTDQEVVTLDLRLKR